MHAATPEFASENGLTVSDVNLDQLGPVDYAVVEFPAGASSFTGETAAASREDGGSVAAAELSDVAELQALETELAELLAADDQQQTIGSTIDDEMRIEQ